MRDDQILVVEDDPRIQELLQYNLKKERFSVLSANSAEQALQTLERTSPQLVLLDLMLPGMDGLTLCRRLKSEPQWRSIPIIMLTARREEADMVAGLELGADDYLPKPFSVRVLLARIRAVLRRVSEEPAPTDDGVIHVREITVNRERHAVTVSGKPVVLTPMEFRVLAILVSKPGKVFTRAEIADAAHHEENVVTDRAVDVQIAALRRKLGSAGRYIETVRGVGYRFQV